MRAHVLLSLVVLAGCQSLTQPITEASMPSYRPHTGGQPRFPLQDELVVAANTEMAAPAADAKTECKRPSLVSVNAVGNPCETTRSFMQSRGMTEGQMKRVEALSAVGH